MPAMSAVTRHAKDPANRLWWCWVGWKKDINIFTILQILWHINFFKITFFDFQQTKKMQF